MSILDILDAHYPSFQSWNEGIGTRPQPEFPKLKVLDLFSGIGGFSLGLERTGGFETVAFCEIEPFPRRVLAKHWPNVPIYEDVRELTAERLRADGVAVDVICGGFPCQDLSVAGKGAGLAGSRSGLWSEITRLVGSVRPDLVVVENVSALLSRGLGTVLGDLAALGYDAEWHCIPASAVGAPHPRDRFWLVANPQRERPATGEASTFGAAPVRDFDRQCERGEAGRPELQSRAGGHGLHVSDADQRQRQSDRSAGRVGWGRFAGENAQVGSTIGTHWLAQPGVGRVVDGLPGRVDRLRALGNAVVPQIPELIGYAILHSLREGRTASKPVRPSSVSRKHQNASQSGQEGRV